MPTPRLKSATELRNYSRDLRPLEWGFGSSRGNDAEPPMSSLGQKQTWRGEFALSALPTKADIGTQSRNVRFVPKADIGEVIRSPHPQHLIGRVEW